MVPGARPSSSIPAVGGEPAYEIPLGDDHGAETADEAPARASPPAAIGRRTAITARAVLPKTPLFSALAERDLARLIEGVRRQELPAGKTLFSQGDGGDCLYVVASGEVAVLAPREVARLREGAFFGEIALLTAAPRSATIRARADSELLVIDRRLAHELVAESPRVLEVLLRFLGERLVANLTETSELFSPFTPGERARLASRFQFLQAAARTRLVEQDKRSPGLFVLLAGRARVVTDGTAIATLGPRDVFGETSLLTAAPAAAAVVTEERSFLLHLPRALFAEIASTHPQVLEYLAALAESRAGAPARLSSV
jgi:CRP-like cAMP-binding protein